jgi:ABC-type antimicrobial peptide transport system permease subunit
MNRLGELVYLTAWTIVLAGIAVVIVKGMI